MFQRVRQGEKEIPFAFLAVLGGDPVMEDNSKNEQIEYNANIEAFKEESRMRLEEREILTVWALGEGDLVLLAVGISGLAER